LTAARAGGPYLSKIREVDVALSLSARKKPDFRIWTYEYQNRPTVKAKAEGIGR
jgi:hypothetical protein